LNSNNCTGYACRSHFIYDCYKFQEIQKAY
jgi:hypothetical protein